MKGFCGGVVLALLLALVVSNEEVSGDVEIPVRHSQPRVLYVLAIGIGDYAEVYDVPGAAMDAQAVAAILKKGAAALYDVVEVVELVDQQATMAAILGAVNEAAGLLKAEDTFMLYFSGHVHARDGEQYLVPHDARVTAGEPRNEARNAMNLVGTAHLREALATVQAKQRLLLFDSMHFDIRIGVQGTHVILGAGPGGVAFAEPDGAPFTRVLLQAMQGWADADQDGVVSVFELAVFVGRQLPALDSNPQIPDITLYGTDFPLLSKDSRDAPALADKLDVNLVDLIRVYEAQGMEGIQAYSAEHQLGVLDGQVQVIINAVSPGALDALKDRVIRLGGAVETEFENILYAALPVGALKKFVMQEKVWRVDWSRQVFGPPRDRGLRRSR